MDLASSLGLEIPAVRVGTIQSQASAQASPTGRTDPRLFRGPPRFYHKKRRHRTSIKSKISRYHGQNSTTVTNRRGHSLVHLGPASSPKQAIGVQYNEGKHMSTAPGAGSIHCRGASPVQRTAICGRGPHHHHRRCTVSATDDDGGLNRQQGVAFARCQT